MSKVISDIKRQLNYVEDSMVRIDLINQLIIESRDNDSVTSLTLAKETLELALALKYKKGIAYSTLNIGYLKDFQGEKHEALVNMENALKIFQSLHNKKGMGYAYKYLCWYYWGLGEMNKALKLMLKGLKLNEGTQTVIEGWALFVIGVFYTDMKDYKLAKQYLESALKIFNSLKYEHGMGRTLNGLSTVYFKLGQNEKALVFSLDSLKIHKGANYQMGLARSYNDIGAIYTKKKQYEAAANYLEKSLNIRKKAKNRQAVITTLIALGDIYYQKKEYKRALTYLNEAENFALEIDAKTKLIRIKQIMIRIYEALDKPWEALKHHKMYFNLNENLLKLDASSRIKSMETSLNAEKKERQIEKGRLKNAKLKLQKHRVEMLFGQQVSSEVVQTLLNNKNKEDIQRTEATIMFLDIRNFTVFARGKDPEDVIKFQNNIFSPLIEIITKYNGIINQFLGDGFMASFGIPISDESHCQNAFDAGKSIIKRMHQLAEAKVIPITRIGIGLHSGEVISGNIGNKIRKQFSIAGENVIVAARLEQLNKQFQSQFLISKDVFDRIDSKDINLKLLGEIDLKGFKKLKSVYQVY